MSLLSNSENQTLENNHEILGSVYNPVDCEIPGM